MVQSIRSTVGRWSYSCYWLVVGCTSTTVCTDVSLVVWFVVVSRWSCGFCWLSFAGLNGTVIEWWNSFAFSPPPFRLSVITQLSLSPSFFFQNNERDEGHLQTHHYTLDHMGDETRQRLNLTIRPQLFE